MKQLLKKILPFSIVKGLTRRNSNKWKGDFATWPEAVQTCSGYDARNIFEKVKDAALKVKSGEAVYEQDGVLFFTEHYSWPLLSGLLLVAAVNRGQLSVMDFGGALGNTYFQHRKYLQLLPSVKWNVIDQNTFVQFGGATLQDEQLQFYLTAEECVEKNGLPNILVISTTLPYLEDPRKKLQLLMKLNFPYLIIDNTVFNFEHRDRLTVQHVPKTIYEASYPCWFLDYTQLLAEVKQYYDIISEHNNEHIIDLDGHAIRFRGLFGKLKME